MMNRNEIIELFPDLFWSFDFDKYQKLSYMNESYNLDDRADLVDLIEKSTEQEDYAITKIANNILCVLEITDNQKEYLHTPVIMHMELSSFCNCECIMCAHSYEKNDRAKYLSSQTMSELEEYFPACRIVIINGYGEPFIHPEIRDIILTYEKYGIKLFTTTNLQVLPEDILPSINKVFQRINISCDGANSNTYESIRKNASYRKFVENGKILKKNCPDVQLFLSVVAMRQNILEIVEIVQLACELGFEEVRFGRLGVNDFIGNEKDDLINYPNLSSYMFDEAVKEGNKTGIRVVTPLIMRNNDIDMELVEKEKKLVRCQPFYREKAYWDKLREDFRKLYEMSVFEPHEYSLKESIACEGICHWIAFGMYINVSGNVRPCSEIPYNRYQEKTKQKINYNYEELVRFREVFMKGKVPEACLDCAFIMSDEIGCLKVRIDEYKKFFEERKKRWDMKNIR